MQKINIREGTVRDYPFLKQMLYDAVFWNSDEDRIPIGELFKDPEIAKCLQDWAQREGDFALIAIDEHENAIGAAWYRFWSEGDHSFGYVSSHIPELGISIRKEYRSRGIGKILMNNILKYIVLKYYS